MSAVALREETSWKREVLDIICVLIEYQLVQTHTQQIGVGKMSMTSKFPRSTK
jgi:hypothetical protein